jgi:tRNA threonylcarbamoyl adenosine modification protein YeaZ
VRSSFGRPLDQATQDALRALAVTVQGPLAAFDTSTPTTSAVVVDPEHGVREQFWPAAERADAVLVPGLMAMLQAFGRTPADLKGIVVGLGPGSFTGLRVGLATAKGLALGGGIPVYGASSLQMAAVEAGPGRVLAVQDARHGETFAALYAVAADGAARVCLADAAWTHAALEAAVDEVCAADGTGLRVVGDAAVAWATQKTRVQVMPDAYPRAVWGLLGRLPAILAGQADAAATLVPRYLRLSEPERKQQARAALGSSG